MLLLLTFTSCCQEFQELSRVQCLLLAPYNQSENINRKQDRHIKEALFSLLLKFLESFNFCTINTGFRLSLLYNRCFHTSVVLDSVIYVRRFHFDVLTVLLLRDRPSS